MAKKPTTAAAKKKPTPGLSASAHAPKEATQRTVAPESIIDQVRRQYAFILAAFALGESLEDIAASLKPTPLVGTQLRLAISTDAELSRMWEECKEHRAHGFVEASGTAAKNLFDTGFKKEAGDLYLKLAAKTAPHLYGDKTTVALTGANGGPVAATVEMTPSEAYQRMLGSHQ